MSATSQAQQNLEEVSIASGLQRNPNLTYVDAHRSLLGTDLQTNENWSGWLRNVHQNLILHPGLDVQLRGARDPEWWFTGIKPDPCGASLSPMPHPDMSCVTKAQAIAYFNHSWMLTEVLFGALQGLEAFYRPPYHNHRHPLIFYYVHPAVLYVNKFRLAGLLSQTIDLTIEITFESGVDSMSWDDLSKNKDLWPSFATCLHYRRQAYQVLLSTIDRNLTDGPQAIGPSSQMWALFLGIAHEAIHLETSSVLLRELPLSLLLRPAQWPKYQGGYILISTIEAHPSDQPAPKQGVDYPHNDFVEIPQTTINLGRGNSITRVFGWDNEFGVGHVNVPNFHISKFPVTNGQFYPFVTSAEYLNDRWWTQNGQAWRKSRNIKCPTFWVSLGPQGLHDYGLRLIFDIVEMPWNAPVCVNIHEAMAFASWSGCAQKKSIRLSTEPELTVLRSNAFPSAKCRDDFAQQDPILSSQTPVHGNLNLWSGAETPVDLLSPTSLGTYDVCGNVWQWCLDEFLPLPGFATHPYYIDFSSPCFDRAHNIIFGGSFISTGNLANHFARYHFRPFFYQHAGFRLAYSAGTSDVTSPHYLLPTTEHLIENEKQSGEAGGARTYDYESNADLARYMGLHFNVPNDDARLSLVGTSTVGYTQRIYLAIDELLREHAVERVRALDLGCATGGLAFELAISFQSVIGIDLSKRFISTCAELQSGQTLAYELVDEGQIMTSCQFHLDDLHLGVAHRCQFEVGDACDIRSGIGSFNFVCMINLLCRLPKPRACLARSLELVLPGGLLFLMTPCSYSDAFAPPSEWLGGKIDPLTGNPIRTEQTLQNILSPGFSLVFSGEIPLVIRLHSRKFELIFSSLTVWKRK